MRWAFLSVLLCSSLHAASNSVTLTETSGATLYNYPVQIARPFALGEIAQYPQVQVDGIPVTTQATVKSRWPGGSARHAILSFYISTFTANSQVNLTFQNQATDNVSGFLDTAAMTAFPNFDAVLETTFGSASAATLIGNEQYQYWTWGSIATTVIVGDHSHLRTGDMGSTADKAFRPLFHVTFWPLIGKVKVRFIGEITNTTALRDESYTLTLRTGAGNTIVYGPKAITHHGLSRWTKTFWIGGEPAPAAMNPNLAYLAENGFLPNYDPSKSIAPSLLTTRYNEWQASGRDLFEAGRWDKLMPNAGGRPDIGPFPDWTIYWLYSGDIRAQEIAFGQADLAAAWPMNFREGLSGRFFNAAHTVSALGKPMSLYGRPTVLLNRGNQYMGWSFTDVADKVVPVGPMTDGGWLCDAAHQPEAFTPQYILSGDYFYLEQMQFWAAWGAFDANPFNFNYGRGPTPSSGGIFDEVRGDAWLFRNRVHAAAWSPDGTPEKEYFERLVLEAITIWEGSHAVTSSPRVSDPLWTWGNTVGQGRFLNSKAPTLHFWDAGNTRAGGQDPMDTAVVEYALSPWMQNFLIIALGIGRDLGYPTDLLLDWVGTNLLNQILNPEYDPYRVAAFQMPVSTKTGKPFDSWLAMRQGFKSDYNSMADFETKKGYSDDYTYIALGATSMVAGSPGGRDAWRWMSNQLLNQPAINSSPKYAILPRSQNAAPLGSVSPTAQLSISNVRAYPNPWRADRHRGRNVTFDRLQPGATIKIFTVSGRSVIKLEATGTFVEWDLKGSGGSAVASGIYLYAVEWQGQKKTGKIVLIK